MKHIVIKHKKKESYQNKTRKVKDRKQTQEKEPRETTIHYVEAPKCKPNIIT